MSEGRLGHVRRKIADPVPFRRPYIAGLLKPPGTARNRQRRNASRRLLHDHPTAISLTQCVERPRSRFRHRASLQHLTCASSLTVRKKVRMLRRDLQRHLAGFVAFDADTPTSGPRRRPLVAQSRITRLQLQPTSSQVSMSSGCFLGAESFFPKSATSPAISTQNDPSAATWIAHGRRPAAASALGTLVIPDFERLAASIILRPT